MTISTPSVTWTNAWLLGRGISAGNMHTDQYHLNCLHSRMRFCACKKLSVGTQNTLLVTDSMAMLTYLVLSKFGLSTMALPQFNSLHLLVHLLKFSCCFIPVCAIIIYPFLMLILFIACVMNVLTHRAAYCFFPHLTLIENCSLLNSVNLPFSDRQLLSLVKYGQRGFYFMNMPSVFRTIDRKSALSFFFPRSPGDRHSYKLKFIHVGSGVPKPVTIEAHSWTMSYCSRNSALSCTPLITGLSVTKYVIAPQLWLPSLSKLHLLLPLAHDSNITYALHMSFIRWSHIVHSLGSRWLFYPRRY